MVEDVRVCVCMYGEGVRILLISAAVRLGMVRQGPWFGHQASSGKRTRSYHCVSLKVLSGDIDGRLHDQDC